MNSSVETVISLLKKTETAKNDVESPKSLVSFAEWHFKNLNGVLAKLRTVEKGPKAVAEGSLERLMAKLAALDSAAVVSNSALFVDGHLYQSVLGNDSVLTFFIFDYFGNFNFK